MTVLEWCPKPYTAGDIDGAGLRKLLGASHHAPLSLLVRETLQNSWDASRRSDGSPWFDTPPSWVFELRHLSTDEAEDLRSAFSTLDVPGTSMEEVLSDDLRVIEISDRRTVGLGGPLHYDRTPEDDAPTDFIDLVYNIGAPQDTHGGGGTYGFGKIAAFGMSDCSTVLYRTRPLIGETRSARPTSRLIGSTIGDNFNLDGRRWTGRHWWGHNEDGEPRPLLGQAADALSERLFAHPLPPDDTGTSLLILQPRLAGLSPESAVQHVIDAVLWNAWPKLVPRRGEEARPMEMEVRLDGAPVELPDPAKTRPFSGFVSALHAVRASIAGDDPSTAQTSENTVHVSHHEFRSGNPDQLVGHASVARCFAPGVSRADDESHLDVYSPVGFRGAAQHLALLREPELVVTYLEGPPATSGMEWCGVFRPLPELDGYFALAEPPSHDDWLAGRVDDRRGKIFINRGRKHGPRQLFRELFTPQGADARSTATHSLAHVADHLGHLVGEGQRPSPAPGRASGTTQRRGDVHVLRSRPVVLADGVGGIMVDFETLQRGRVSVRASVGLAGGGSDDSTDIGDRLPRVLGITPTDASSPDSALDSPSVLASGRWRAWIANPGRVTVAANVRLEEVAS